MYEKHCITVSIHAEVKNSSQFNPDYDVNTNRKRDVTYKPGEQETNQGVFL